MARIDDAKLTCLKIVNRRLRDEIGKIDSTELTLATLDILEPAKKGPLVAALNQAYAEHKADVAVIEAAVDMDAIKSVLSGIITSRGLVQFKNALGPGYEIP